MKYITSYKNTKEHDYVLVINCALQRNIVHAYVLVINCALQSNIVHAYVFPL